MCKSKMQDNVLIQTQNMRNIRILLLIMMLQWIVSFTSSAQGDLLITPRRVVFEGTKKLQELNLANTGKDTAKYQISIIQIRMKDDGAFETITQPDSGQLFADPYLRYFPRSVTLAPNESQTIKIQLIKFDQLSPGEYRSHFYFRSIPNLKPLGEAELGKDTTSFSVKLMPVFGITIPVIIRKGESTVNMSISDISLIKVNDTTSRIQVAINRNGNMSVYGDLEIKHISPQGKVTQVGIAKGIAVYTPNNIRTFKLDLNHIPGIDFSSGKMHALFTAQVGVKSVIKAEKEIILH